MSSPVDGGSVLRLAGRELDRQYLCYRNNLTRFGGHWHRVGQNWCRKKNAWNVRFWFFSGDSFASNAPASGREHRVSGSVVLVGWDTRLIEQ